MDLAPLDHVFVDEAGVARLKGTRWKVHQIAVEKIEWLWDADQIQRQHPDLTLGQIHAALSYYYDHKDEIERRIEADNAFAEEYFKNHPNPVTREDLLARLQR